MTRSQTAVPASTGGPGEDKARRRWRTMPSHHARVLENVTHVEMAVIAEGEEHSHVADTARDDYHVDEGTTLDPVMDGNATLLCVTLADTENWNMTENMTDFDMSLNCSDGWMDYESTTETAAPSTTDDSDIPNIPISILQYPTPLRTTPRPSMVTLPPMIWQPLGQPGIRRGITSRCCLLD